jgi:hypothetical protein
MRNHRFRAVAVAAAMAVAAVGYAHHASAQAGGWGPGMMRGYGPPGMMGGWMGPGMMGYGPGGGYGPGWMGPGMMGWLAGPPADLKLTVDDVKTNMERWLTVLGNPHVKLGNVAQKDADTITADIVTVAKDDLVQRYDINVHTGFVRPEG